MDDLRGLELRHLRHFVALADTHHFGRAAQRVGIAQPPFSQSIARLEGLVGHRLFERARAGPVRVRPTEAGLALLPVARRLLDEVERGVAAARAAARGEVGTLRVGFVASLALGSLPAALGRHRREQPGVRLELLELTTGAMLAALAERTVDLGLGRELAGSAAVEVQPLYRERLVAVLPADDPLAESRIIALAALRERAFILPPARAGARFVEHLGEVLRQAGFTPRVVQEATEWQTVLGLVGAGVGVSVAPRCAARHPPPGVRAVALSDPAATTGVAAAWRAGEASPLRERLVAMLRQSGPSPKRQPKPAKATPTG